MSKKRRRNKSTAQVILFTAAIPYLVTMHHGKLYPTEQAEVGDHYSVEGGSTSYAAIARTENQTHAPYLLINKGNTAVLRP